ncbi:hypothetical protein AVEN_141735-1 [Araneus ventricosus]|uniref:Pre-C2HC domain-containing protein n=1 Tax=Araneus ventricosus TaxID=182803 RepID=A0A4Y2IAT2_ARAVE|nr:hypothetical protein AVEN_141735-1 [Araneus ventricosus]
MCYRWQTTPLEPVRMKKENFRSKCVNCGHPHTASYRGCPTFPKVGGKKKLKEKNSFTSLCIKKNKETAKDQPSTNNEVPTLIRNEDTPPPSSSTSKINPLLVCQHAVRASNYCNFKLIK